MRTAAIMQPTYLSWLGYYHLIDQADTFTLLDTVQLNTRSWQTRNRIRARDGNTVWLTIPVHASRDQTIATTRIDNTQPWQRKHWRTIQAAYSHAPHWDDLDRILWPHYETRYAWLADLTSSLIRNLADHLGITTPISLASDLPPTSTDRIIRLADICHHHHADTFIEPTGGTYLAGQNALAGGIHLTWHDYRHPVYSQGNQPFQAQLSIIDLIAWHGPDSLAIIRGQSREAVAA